MQEMTQKTLANVPDLTHNRDFKMLWYSDWYDGELDGMCEWRGQKYWFFYIDDNEFIEKEKTYMRRVFGVYKISDEQIEHEDYWQGLYELCCGGSNRYNMPGHDKDSRIPENKFYKDLYYARVKLNKKEIKFDDIKDGLIGWFEY